MWGEKYDGAVSDIFEIQDKITESIVGQIEPTIRLAEIEVARRKPAQNLDSYDLFLKALAILHDPGIERHAEAIELLGQAMEHDPNYALPAAYSAEIYEKRISLRAPALGPNDAATAVDLAKRALRVDSSDPLVRSICAWVLFRVNGESSAVNGVRRAVEENPYHVTILQHAAAVVGMRGDAKAALEYHARAYALSPGGPEAYDALFGMAGSELMLGNNEKAIQWAQKSLATFKDLLFTHITLTAAHANLDQMEAAQASLKKVRELSPHLTIKLIVEGAANEDSFAWAVIPGLRKAGLPER